MSLRSLRHAQGWSQEDLALAAGLSPRTIQRLEAGRAASLEARRALAAAFDRPLGEIDRALAPDRTRRPDRRWRLWFGHVALWAAVCSLTAGLAAQLDATPRLPAGLAMLWGGAVLLHLAWQLHDRARTPLRDWGST